MISFTDPSFLYFLPLALVPLLLGLLKTRSYSSFQSLPEDHISVLFGRALKIASVLAILGTIIGLSGPYLGGREINHIGTGANIVMVIDRSESMNQSFAGRDPSGGLESKAAAAKELLKEFVQHRKHDQFGIVGFYNVPIFIAPLTFRRDIILSAIEAIDEPGLSQTNVGLGLAMALKMLEDAAPQGPRTIVLVSDGAAVISIPVQKILQAAIARNNVSLHWLFLRTANSRGIFDLPTKAGEDTPQVMPERHLHKYFESLGIPYQAYEAEDEKAIGEAIAEIDKLESKPIPYVETSPRFDLKAFFYALAAFASLLLVLAKLAEIAMPVSGREQGGEDDRDILA